MALTLEVEQRLVTVGLEGFFKQSEPRWCRLARDSHAFIAKDFPTDATVRADDVAKALVPLLEVDKDFRAFLAVKKLKQKYWVRDFCDFILDRCWNKIN